MLDPADPVALASARAAERALFEGVVALEGSISGEHGIGFSKLPFVPLELSWIEIDLQRRIKAAFDPLNILNPGKMFPDKETADVPLARSSLPTAASGLWRS